MQFDDAGLARALGTSALVLILAEGGLTTNWALVRAAAPAALTLATVGVAVSTLVVAAAAHWLLSFGWRANPATRRPGKARLTSAFGAEPLSWAVRRPRARIE